MTCLKNNMVITIPKYVLRGADREHIRALNVSCTASENLTHFFLDVPLTSCGTKRSHTISSVVYTNEALPAPPMLEDVVSHVPDFQIPFHCYYDNNGVVTSVGLKPFSKKVIFSKKGFGRFVIKLNLFPDTRFAIPLLFIDSSLFSLNPESPRVELAYSLPLRNATTLPPRGQGISPLK